MLNIKIDVDRLTMNFIGLMFCLLLTLGNIYLIKLRNYVKSGNVVHDNTPVFNYWYDLKRLQICLSIMLTIGYEYMDPFILYIVLGFSAVGLSFEIWYEYAKCKELNMFPSMYDD